MSKLLCLTNILTICVLALGSQPVPAQGSGAPSFTQYDKIYDVAHYFVDGTANAKPFAEPDVDKLLDRYGFQPMKGIDSNFGYENRVHWIFIPLTDLQRHELTYLSFNYPLIDYLDVYKKQGGEPWRLVYETGDKRAFDSRPVDDRVFNFPIMPETDYVLLRIQTAGSLIAPLSLMGQDEMSQRRNTTTLLLGLFFGALGIMCVYNLFIYLFSREVSFFYYVATLFFVLIYLLAMSGFGYQWVWRENGQWVNEHIQPITVGMILGCVCLFSRSVLQLKVYVPLLARTLNWLAKLAFGVALVGFFAPLQWLIHFISFLPILVIGVVIASGVFAIKEHVSGAGFFLFAWGGSLLGALIFTLHQIGVLPNHPLFAHGLNLGVLFNTVFLSFSLVSHINVLKKEKQKAEEVASENYRLALIDSLTGIPNRRAFDHNYRLEYRRSSREQNPLSVLMVDVDFFKRYNDEYGHARGDAVLKEVARVLTESLSRPADSAFRYGGEEFVVLLPDTTVKGAEHLAQNIIKGVAQRALPHRASPFAKLTVSIGLATDVCFDNDQLALLERADEALYSAKTAGRNQYAIHGTSQTIRVVK